MTQAVKVPPLEMLQVIQELKVLKSLQVFQVFQVPSRYSSTAVSLPNTGTFILGGEESPTSSVFLPSGGSSWQDGPTLPGGGAYGACSVAIGEDQFLLIGGSHERRQVLKPLHLARKAFRYLDD